MVFFFFTVNQNKKYHQFANKNKDSNDKYLNFLDEVNSILTFNKRYLNTTLYDIIATH